MLPQYGNKLLKDAPKRFIRGTGAISDICISTILISYVTVIPVPTDLCALSVSFLPAHILR